MCFESHSDKNVSNMCGLSEMSDFDFILYHTRKKYINIL